MSRSKHTEAQMIAALKQMEAGQTLRPIINGKWAYNRAYMSRLAAAHCAWNCPVAGGNHLGLSWDYDRYGNRWDQKLTAGSWLAPAGLTFNGGNNRMDGYSYDASGDLLSDGLSHNFSYDAEGRIANATGVSYFYDASGRRVAKEDASGNFTSFLYDLGGHIVAELTNGSFTRGEVYLGGRHLATYANGQTYFDFNDWLGTERAKLGYANDALAASLSESCTSGPWGDNLDCGNSLSDLHFTGKMRDSESGLDYFGARYYSGAGLGFGDFGRFMTPDWSAKVEPVPYAKLAFPQTLNLYSYVGNNPVSWIDRDGHYNCQGTNQQCQIFKKALAMVQKADISLKKGTFERKRLDAVLKYYGTDNGKGPTITFGDLSKYGAVGLTQTKNGKTTITFDTKALTVFHNAGQGETIAHEGTHGMDANRPEGGAGMFWTLYDKEYRAYQSESYVDMGLGEPNETDWKPAWAPGMYYKLHVLNMTRDAYQNALADCQGVEGCAP